MKLSDRQVQCLRVLSAENEETERGLYAGRVAHLAGFKFSQRMDAGATATLDSLERVKLTRSEYGRSLELGGIGFAQPGRRWWITDEGREALGEWAFGD